MYEIMHMGMTCKVIKMNVILNMVRIYDYDLKTFHLI